MRCVRIRAEYAEDPDEYPLSFDLIVDDRNRVVGDRYAAGVAGRPEEEIYFPVILLDDGTIDFGAAFERAEERWWRTDLRERPIVRDGSFTVWEADDEYEYRIVELIDLAELD